MRVLFLLPLLVVGCAYNRPHLFEGTKVTEPNGRITETSRDMTLRSYSILTSTEAITKQKASIGKTMGVGTEGLGQEAISPAVAKMLQSIGETLIQIGKSTAMP